MLDSFPTNAQNVQEFLGKLSENGMIPHCRKQNQTENEDTTIFPSWLPYSVYPRQRLLPVGT